MDSLASAIALSNRLAELARWSSVLDSWLNRWTSLVVIGVVLEVAFVAWEYQMELQEFRRGTIRSPEKPKLLKYIIEFLGAGLVAIGVAGELVVHTRSGKIETEMRDATTQQVSIANTRAGDAIKEAARLSKDAAKMTKDAEDERLARVKIEERVAWRHLTKEQQSGMAARLKRFSGQWGNVERVSSDVEITSFATDIAQTLSAAGWHVSPPSAITVRETRMPAFGNPIEPVITGVSLYSTPDIRAREMADALSGELHSLGYDALVNSGRQSVQGNFSIVWVLIEARPEGPQGEAKLAKQKASPATKK